MDKITERIERQAGIPGLAALLAERLSPTDLQSLLLAVNRLRSARIRPADVLTGYAADRFVRPSPVSPVVMLRWDQIAFAHLPPGFEPIALAPFVRVLFRSWASLALISLVIGCAFVSAVLASSLVGIFAVFALLALGWALLYASFFPQAVTLAGHKPLNAVLSSLLVVRSSLWPTLGLLVLVNLLDTGLSLIWYRAIGSGSAVTFVAILASAFVGTGLTAALFYFYRDRSAALRSLIMAQGKT